MIGMAGRQHVIINMPVSIEAVVITQHNNMDKQQLYTFTNIINVTVKNISVSCISVSFEGREFSAVNAILNFYGYANFTSKYVSVINITGSALVLFGNCTFQENIVSYTFN